MVNSTPYYIPKHDVVHETIVNRSRFICAICHCHSKDQVKAFIEQQRRKYPDASHHCYAFNTSWPDNSQAYGFSDDGEPSGTAGRPMLAALQGADIGEICAVVIRYFGGTKLGTGGLQRAYALSVRQALEQLVTQLKVPSEELNLICDYHQVKDIEHLVGVFSGKVVEQAFTTDVTMLISLAVTDVDTFCARLTDHSGGRVVISKDK